MRVLLAPGTAGLPPAVLSAGLLLAGAVALVRTGRPRLALGGWGLAGVGVVPGLLDPASGVLLVHAGVLLAVAAGADGLPAWLASASFGRRQVGALVVTAGAARSRCSAQPCGSSTAPTGRSRGASRWSCPPRPADLDATGTVRAAAARRAPTAPSAGR